MSRKELADLVNQYIWDNYRQQTGLDENYVGKLERNVVQWPRELYREALRAVLGAADDADLGFHPPRGRRPSATGDTMAMLQTAGGSMAAASASLLDVMTPTPHPGRIGKAEIDQVWWAAKAFSEWDNLYGGLAREAPVAQLRWSAGLLRGTACPLDRRPELLSAVAYLAHTCGFMAFDGYAFDDARRLLGFGVTCAEEADDWHLRARLLATMARLETWVGHPDRGLTHTQLALVRSDRLTATEQAMLYSLEARALARMQRRQDTVAAIGRADDALADQDVDEDPAWMRYYDAAQHAGDIGAALLDLVLAGAVAPGEARSRHVTAIDGRRPDLVRSRALSQVGLAKLEMASGDPTEAVSIGHAALDTAGPVRSRRVADDLAHLGRLAQRHANQSDVGELCERLAAAAA
jgi:hypothetical protein